MDLEFVRDFNEGLSVSNLYSLMDYLELIPMMLLKLVSVYFSDNFLLVDVLHFALSMYYFQNCLFSNFVVSSKYLGRVLLVRLLIDV